MLARTDSRGRALFLLLVVALVATAIGGRLAWWQVVQRDRLATMAANQLAQRQELPATRGEIRDANGVLLATSVQAQSVFAVPAKVTQPKSEARLLSLLLGVPQANLVDLFTGGQAWAWLARRIPSSVSTRIRFLNLPGIGLLSEPSRVYPTQGGAPDSTLAAQVLGFVNLDGQGQYGVEGKDNALLTGEPGSVVAQEDVNGNQIADSVSSEVSPVNGDTLTLTIDAGLQHLLETSIYQSYKKNLAHGATGIIMNVHTGAILAMASFPSFNANDYSTTNPTLFNNPAVSRAYEPGSVMKAFTIAAALDAGAITTKTKVLDNNDLTLRGVRIQNADRLYYPYGHGMITAQQVLQLSNNNGAARIALKLGGERLYQSLLRYGFGQPTGIDIAGEVGGTVWDPSSPEASGKLTTAQNAFGQGLTVTAIQLVAGYAAIGNGGVMVTPHVVAGWTDPNGTYHPTVLPQGERIMKQETATTVMQLLTGAIDGGIAKGAGIPNYAIAGKTGTAQVAGPVTVRDASGNLVTEQGYVPGWIESSFIGVYPATNPELVTLILLDRPSTWGYYQMVERPETVFHDLAPQILDYLAIPPDRPTTPVAAK